MDKSAKKQRSLYEFKTYRSKPLKRSARVKTRLQRAKRLSNEASVFWVKGEANDSLSSGSLIESDGEYWTNEMAPQETDLPFEKEKKAIDNLKSSIK